MASIIAHFNSPPSLTVRSYPVEAPVGWHDVLVSNQPAMVYAAPGGHIHLFYGSPSQVATFIAGSARTWPTLAALRADSVSAEGILAAVEWPARTVASVVLGLVDYDGEKAEGLEADRNFASSVWTKGNVTVLKDNFQGPDGVNNAEGIVEAASNLAIYGLTQSIQSVITDGACKFYADLKAVGRSWVRLGVLASAPENNAFAWFDLANASAGNVNNCTSSATALTNGYVRCSMNYTHSGTMSAEIVATTGNGGSSMVGALNQVSFLAAYARVSK